jgi:pyruvate/2-oxoglutarate dehydrogenase complex dihydrolipoamide dehydrogenase (E3) component
MPGLKELYAKTGPGGPLVMTNETFFNMTKQPKCMVVIGAGVIGEKERMFLTDIMF